MPEGIQGRADGTARLKHLSWLCRRGMKELDVLLERFVREQRAALALGQWPGLEELLRTEDDKLWDWLQNPETAADEDTRRLLSKIRNEPA